MDDIDIRFDAGLGGLFSKEYRALASRLKNDELRPIAVNFERNCERVFQQIALPMNIVNLTRWVGVTDAQLRAKHGIPLDQEGSITHPEYLAESNTLSAALKERLEKGEVDWEKLWANGRLVLNALAEHGFVLKEASASVLASMVVSAWVCFESLASDLWIEMLNIAPKPLAMNVLAGRKVDGSVDDGRDHKSLGLNVFKEHGFDLSTKMGLVLYEKKANFATVGDTVDSYANAFRSSWTPALIQVGELRKLELLRNLFAHRGGVVDRKFKSSWKEPTMIPLQVGQIYYVTGDVVRDLMDVVVATGLGLITFADNWLNERRTSSDKPQP